MRWSFNKVPKSGQMKGHMSETDRHPFNEIPGASFKSTMLACDVSGHVGENDTHTPLTA